LASNNLFIYYHTPSSLLLHLSIVISSKLSLLLLQEVPTESIFFDRSSPDPYSLLSCHQYCIFLFLFGLLFFAIKLKYTNSRIYRSYCRDDNVADQCIHGGQILDTSIGTCYNIHAAYTFSIDETINIHDLKRHIHVGLKLLASHFNITINAWINTAPSGSGVFFHNLFGIISEEIWRMVKITAPCQIFEYKTLGLVVESELISSYDHYDLYSSSIPESSNPILAKERTNSRAQEHSPSRVPVQ
jgi:hypothetical protein